MTTEARTESSKQGERPLISAPAHLLFLLFGLAAFVILIHRSGLENVLEPARRAGWSLVLVMMLWLAIYLMNTLAWRLILGVSGAKVPFARLFSVFLSGYALNTVTPFIAVGGEPYRAGMLADSIGTHASVSAVALYRAMNFLGHMVLMTLGAVVGLLTLPMADTLRWWLGGVVLVIGTLGYWAFTVHRDGIFVRLAAAVRRIGVLRRFSHTMDKHAAELAAMDRLFTDAFRHRRARFVAALLIEVLTRAMMGLEVFIILRGAGTPITFGGALFIYIVYSLIINVVFFIPLNLGVRESGLMLGLQGLAMTPLLGVYLGVIIRIREILWILLGLFFVLVSTVKKLIVLREAQQP